MAHNASILSYDEARLEAAIKVRNNTVSIDCPPPSFTLNTYTINLSPGDAATIRASSSVNWSVSSGLNVLSQNSTTIVIEGISTGNYSVTATKTNSCGSTWRSVSVKVRNSSSTPPGGGGSPPALETLSNQHWTFYKKDVRLSNFMSSFIVYVKTSVVRLDWVLADYLEVFLFYTNAIYELRPRLFTQHAFHPNSSR